MAEDKKGFLLYADYKTTVDKLIEKDRANGTNNAGELFCHILNYVNDLNPVPVNDTIDLIFEPIKNQLKRDLKSYEVKKMKLSANGREGGLKSAEARRSKSNQIEAIASMAQAIQPANDNVNDNALSIAGAISKNTVVEFLRMATNREYITDDQINQEADNFKEKYDGMKIGNLKSLCNMWAGNIKPWQKITKKLSSFI